MTKKDYERAALLVQDTTKFVGKREGEVVCAAFTDFFRGDNPRFDANRFQRACAPGANVRARETYSAGGAAEKTNRSTSRSRKRKKTAKRSKRSR